MDNYENTTSGHHREVMAGESGIPLGEYPITDYTPSIRMYPNEIASVSPHSSCKICNLDATLAWQLTKLAVNSQAYAPVAGGQLNRSSMQEQHQYYNPQIRSSRSSVSSSLRYSDCSSIFSQQHPRSSVSSTHTTRSQVSHRSRGSLSSQLESPLESYQPEPHRENPRRSHSISRPVIRENQSAQQDPYLESDFSTCVSRRKRGRTGSTDLKYWCTSCGEGFGKKFDWKRHEETFQERTEKYSCGLCNKTFFLAKDFQKHHQDTHRCTRCDEDRHVEKAKEMLKTRTAWGCGICSRLDFDWIERCRHVARHFEEGHNFTHWHHTHVILALLGRPGVNEAWHSLMEKKAIVNPWFRFHRRTTARAEGFPYSGRAPQLQDLLEFFTPEQDAQKLVEQAWEEGYKEPPPVISPPVPTPPVATHLDKDLPPMPYVAELDKSPMDLDDPNNEIQQLLNSTLHDFNAYGQVPLGPSSEVSHGHHEAFISHENWDLMATTMIEDPVMADTYFMNFNALGPNDESHYNGNYAFYPPES